MVAAGGGGAPASAARALGAAMRRVTAARSASHARWRREGVMRGPEATRTPAMRKVISLV